MRGILIILAVTMLILPQITGADGTVVQTDDFSLRLPTNFAAQVRDDGFRLTQTDGGRHVQRLEIFTPQIPDRATEGQFKIKNVTGFDRPFLYTIKAIGSGSGGTEYQLTAIGADNAGRPVVMIAQDQTEQGPPGFAFAWDILGSYSPKR